MARPGFGPLPDTQQIQTLAFAGRDLAFTERRCQLTVLSGPDQGKSVEVAKGRFTVGKGEDSDLVLTDPTVSRTHFVIEQRQGAYVVRDDASTNGTWIDQLRIKEAYLRPGVVLRAGQVELRFEPLFKPIDIAPSIEERFGSLVGRSVRMRQIFTMCERVARTEATVVIFGETGTGKSAVAQAIHEASPRRNGPFVTVDCGAIAESLIESELFGHEKGAFTGAVSQRKGALEKAQGGTLFIDELVDLRLDLQPRLLRVLEEREVRRVGANDPIKLDVRIIAASRHDLWREVQEYRLAVFTLPLPSLRERREDIPLLAAAFARHAKNGEALLRRLTPQAMERLMAHPFPGNVRELRNVVERAILLDADPTEMLEHSLVRPVGASVDAGTPEVPAAVPLPPPPPPAEDVLIGATSGGAAGASNVDSAAVDTAVSLVADCTLPFKGAKERLLEQFEGEYFRRLIARAGGNASAIARLAGIDRKHVYTLAKKHGLPLGRGRDDDQG